ncbi:MAG: hypothetical protein OXC39_02740 [Candidatus Dadabacteria bacterium]|nr:hypothetical protein [Candidatus Dadabacteria bacterium]
MFEISKHQLRQLNDADLRELVARLCEAELKNAGAPVSALKWGGAQTASDKGLDIECCIEDDDFSGDFLPSVRTGIQVKKSKMPDSRIEKEMSPKGQLRPVFSELARNNGCYIIVSLHDDLVSRKVNAREKTMRKQLETIKEQGDLQVRFYGCSELANWLRQYPAVQLWARERLGISLSGWKPFGRWSTTPPHVNDDLICEKGIAIILPEREGEKLDILQGIDAIRKLVRTSEKALRIVGLSGVGKSRIVQALFEESIGDNSLDKNFAIYADLGEDINPSTREVLERLIIEKHSAIMVLDNCPSNIHNQLAGRVSSSSNIRLVTVEYDIQEDRPEVTSVVRINAEGLGIAETLIKRRYPHLGQVNAQRLAELSGGNARLALALADAVSEEKSLSGFSNAELFDRLFYQRGANDIDLLKVAEVLSLIYSFSINPDEGGVDELSALSGLLGQDRRTLYRAAQTLVDRQLAQKRGNWRAVLPHALSNRLAKKALENIPVHDILDTFQGLQNMRLLKSFGKRLGYLHDHEVSQDIVKSWLSSGGLLHDFTQLNDDLIQLLLNVAPVVPEYVLSAIEAQDMGGKTETFFSTKNPFFSVFVNLLTTIAYDPDLFERCVLLLAKFMLSEMEEKDNNGQDRFFGLFSLYLSGTEATPDVREKVCRHFLLSGNLKEQQLGLGMLKAALQSMHWSSLGTFEFGARPRSYGYHPKTSEEQDQWFMRFIALALEIASTKNIELSDQVRDLLTNELRGLWKYPGLRTALGDLARALNDQRPWLEGWLAVRSIKHYDYSKGTEDEMLADAELLNELDEMLRPRQLADEVRTYVLSQNQFKLDEKFDFNDNQKWEKSNKRAAARARDLGMAVAKELSVMDEILQDIFTAQSVYITEFGKGLALKSKDLRSLWVHLIGRLELVGDQAHHCYILNGALEVIHERDEPLAHKILDEAVENHVLRKFIVNLQISAALDRTGVKRLLRSLDFEDTPSWQFQNLAWHYPLDTSGEEGLRDLMLKILNRPDGALTVIQVLYQRLYILKDKKLSLDSDLKRIGLVASAALLRHKSDQCDSDMLSEVLKSCMDETEFSEETSDVFDAYFAWLKKSYGFGGDIKAIEAVLAEKATFRFLDLIFFDPTLKDYRCQQVFNERYCPLSNVNVTTLLNWCQQGNFQERLGMISEAIYPFEEEPESDGVVLSKQAHTIIDATQDPNIVLRNFSTFVQPYVYTGSAVTIIAKRRQAFEVLLKHDRSDIRNAAATQISQIKKLEESMRRYEQADYKQSEQRFE